VVFCCSVLYGQVPDTIRPITTPADDGSPLTIESTGRDSTTIVSNTFFDIFEGDPGRAAFYGLILPGGGQIYNRKWWKLPIVYALESGLIWWIYDSSKQYREFQTAYIFNLNNPTAMPMDVNGETRTNVLKSERDKYRKQREYSWVFFIGGHLITIFEAFIDRHLMEFDVSDDLTFSPLSTGLGVMPGVTYTIPLNKKSKRPQKSTWSLLID